MQTPVGGAGLVTPLPGQQVPMTPEQWQTAKWEAEVQRRNRPLTDEELDALLPVDGYKILEPPPGYVWRGGDVCGGVSGMCVGGLGLRVRMGACGCVGGGAQGVVFVRYSTK